MSLLRPKKISTLPAPDMAMIENIELFDSCVSSAVRINKIKLNSAEKSIFYVFFF